MTYLKILTPPLMILVATLTMACANTFEEKIDVKQKKEISTMAFPKHPGTMKLVTMLDKSVKTISIDEIPEESRFVFYDSEGNIVDKKDAVRAVPIVEERMYSKNGQKLVPLKEATHLWIEVYSSEGKIVSTRTMWRDGIRGGKRKTK